MQPFAAIRAFRLGVVFLQATIRGWIRGVVLLLAARETLSLGRRVCGSSRAGMAGTDGAVRVRDLPRPELRATLSDLYCDDFLARALLGESVFLCFSGVHSLCGGLGVSPGTPRLGSEMLHGVCARSVLGGVFQARERSELFRGLGLDYQLPWQCLCRGGNCQPPRAGQPVHPIARRSFLRPVVHSSRDATPD